MFLFHLQWISIFRISMIFDHWENQKNPVGDLLFLNLNNLKLHGKLFVLFIIQFVDLKLSQNVRNSLNYRISRIREYLLIPTCEIISPRSSRFIEVWNSIWGGCLLNHVWPFSTSILSGYENKEKFWCLRAVWSDNHENLKFKNSPFLIWFIRFQKYWRKAIIKNVKISEFEILSISSTVNELWNFTHTMRITL